MLNKLCCVFLRKYDFKIRQNLLLSSKVILHTIFYRNSRDLENNRDAINKNHISGYSFQLIPAARFETTSIRKKVSMNINKCHAHSDVQTRDKEFGTIFGMIRQCITVLRQNVSLRQRHLSNRHLKLHNVLV